MSAPAAAPYWAWRRPIFIPEITDGRDGRDEGREEGHDRLGGSPANAQEENASPAIIYGGAQEPQNISVERKAVWRQVETGHFLSTIYMLDLDGEKVRVIPRDIQLDPVRDFPLHVDFMRVSKTSRIDVDVSVRFLDEEKSPGLKRGGVLNIVRHTIELSCPADAIPELVDFSLAGLDIGDSIHISAVNIACQCQAHHHRSRLHDGHHCLVFRDET